MYVTMDILSSIGLSQINTIWYCCKLFPNVKKKKKKTKPNEAHADVFTGLAKDIQVIQHFSIYPLLIFSLAVTSPRGGQTNISVWNEAHILWFLRKGKWFKMKFQDFYRSRCWHPRSKLLPAESNFVGDSVYLSESFFLVFFLRKPDLTRGRGKKS